MALEVTGEVGLVAEADARGDPGDRLSLEQALSRRLDPPTEDVRVRRDAERLAEAADEMRRAGSEELAGRGERHRLERVGFEEVAQPLRELAHAAGILLVGVILEMRPEALRDEGEVGLGLERVVGVPKSLVQDVEATTQADVLDRRLVDGAADQALAQQARLEVEHPLAVAATRRRAPVVNDVRREHADHRAPRATMVAVEVVADLAVVDDEDRPRVVRVRRVRVLEELGV